MPDVGDELDPASVGEWLHRALVEACGMRGETWTAGMVDRAMSRLRAVLPLDSQFVVEILWIQQLNAFTAPGRYIYISRRLLEKAIPEEALALTLAHEVAHHQLGHFDLFRGWAQYLPRSAPSAVVALLYRQLERRLYGLDGELAADVRGLELCLTAGYDGRMCLRLFDVLEDDALDRGDLTTALGPDAQINPEVSDRLYAKTAVWIWEHLRGYPSHRRRKQLLAKRLR